MSIYLLYDLETTGIPLWREPSKHPDQPHITQICAALIDDAGKTRGAFVSYIKPDGWTVPDTGEPPPEGNNIAALTGITTEDCLSFGMQIDFALQTLIKMSKAADARVAHSQPFDARMVRIALSQIGASETALDNWKNYPAFCTMKMGAAHVKKAHPERPEGKIKLGRLHEYLFGEPHKNSHTSFGDVQAMIKCFLKMVEEGQELL